MAYRRRLASYGHAIPAAAARGRRPRRFTSSFEKTSPTKSKRARNPKRNHPPPSFLETTRLHEVKPPPHAGTPRYDGPPPSDWAYDQLTSVRRGGSSVDDDSAFEDSGELAAEAEIAELKAAIAAERAKGGV